MQNAVKQKFKTIALVLSVLLISGGIVYYAAEKSTEPQFDNKVDRLLFDRNNKSPKYIITLPDKISKPEVTVAKEKEETKTEKETADERPMDERLRSLVNNTPNLSRLKDLEAAEPLKFIEANSGLLVSEKEESLPRIGDDGKKPWIEYSRPPKFIQPNFSRIAVLIKNLGLDRRTTRAVISKFPGEISLSFSPYAREKDALAASARKYGHETYVDMFLSSKDFLKSDSGPMAMSMTAGQEENKARLRKTVSSKTALGGVVVNRGVADENNSERLKELFENVRSMGLLLIDATGENGVQNITVNGLPRRQADIVIDSDFSRENIRRSFMQAEALSKNKGNVLIVLDPKPVVLMELNSWINSFSPQYSYEEMKEKNITTIEKPFVLVPLSEVVVE